MVSGGTSAVMDLRWASGRPREGDRRWGSAGEPTRLRESTGHAERDGTLVPALLRIGCPQARVTAVVTHIRRRFASVPGAGEASPLSAAGASSSSGAGDRRSVLLLQRRAVLATFGLLTGWQSAGKPDGHGTAPSIASGWSGSEGAPDARLVTRRRRVGCGGLVAGDGRGEECLAAVTALPCPDFGRSRARR